MQHPAFGVVDRRLKRIGILVAAVWALPLGSSAAAVSARRGGAGHESTRQISLRYRQLQRQLRTPRKNEARHVVVIPSFALGTPAERAAIKGFHFYEQRHAFEILRLGTRKNRRVTFVTSVPLEPAVVDYYLSLLPDPDEARQRLVLLSAFDGSKEETLAQRVLAQPMLLDAIRGSVRGRAHLSGFIAGRDEERLSAELGIAMFAAAPDLAQWGTKTASRRIFREERVPMQDGFEDVRTSRDLTASVQRLVRRNPEARRFLIKLNDAFSGVGNATLDLRATRGLDRLSHEQQRRAIARGLSNIEVLYGGAWRGYLKRLEQDGGIVELFVEGERVRSPSVQALVTPEGAIEILSTHEQEVGGANGQVYKGAQFPADPDVRRALHRHARKVGRNLSRKGVIGRFSIDFMTTSAEGDPPRAAARNLRAIEINLRVGGTTHPLETVKLLTDAKYELSTGLLRSKNGRAKYYRVTDNLQLAGLMEMDPGALIAALADRGLVYDQQAQTGPVLHLLGALRNYGKMGFVAIADSPQEAERLYQATQLAIEQIAAQRSAR